MGTVLRFPAERVRGMLFPMERPDPAQILILPVVRIEREAVTDDDPARPGVDATSGGQGGRRRRRARRS